MRKIRVKSFFSFFVFFKVILFVDLHATLPTVDLSMLPETIKLGESSTLIWNSTGATSASMNNGIGSIAVNGMKTVKPTQTIIYTVTVTGAGGSATASVTITVIQPEPTVSIAVSPIEICEGETAVLNWKSINAVNATIDNGIGGVALNGTHPVGPSKTTKYTITVSGKGGTNLASVTLPVENKPKCYAYIPNTLDDNVMVIDTSSNTIIATVQVGSEPKGVAINPDGTCVYVSQKDRISVIDMNSNSIVDTIPVFGFLNKIAVHPKGNRIYVSGSRLENGNWKYLLSVIDPVSRKIIREISFAGSIKGVTPNPDGSRIYVCVYGENKIFVIDTTFYSIIASIAFDMPIDLKFNQDGTKFYVIRGCNETPNNFVIVDTASLSIVSQLCLLESNGVPATPFAIALHPDSSRVYVTHSDDRLSVIDTSTKKLINSFSVVGYAPDALSVLPDGSKIYVVCTNSNWLRIFNSTGYYGLATINLGHSPCGNGNFIGFAAIAVSGTVTKGGTGVDGVNVDFSGEAFSQTVQTDTRGKFILAVKNGNYMLVPTKPGLAFSPQQIRLTVNGTVTGQDFSVLDTSAPPRINIAATPVSVLKGKSVTLVWTVANANSVSLDNGIGTVSSSGSLVVSPMQTTTYTISASNSVLTASAKVSVTVTYPLPTVKLSTSPTIIAPGGSSTLTWASTGADSASVDNGVGIVGVNGSHIVMPTKSTTYKIIVMGQGGVASAKATVTLKYPPPMVCIVANPSFIQPNSSSTLSWSSSNATTATISGGIGIVPVNGTRVVFPKVATTYTITATGQGGSTRANVTVIMLDATLKTVWSNMKTALTIKNIESAVCYFSESTKARYKKLFMSISSQLPQITQGMGMIEYLNFKSGVAVYRIKRKEIIDGQEQLISYRIYFIFENGKWVIYKY